MGHPCRPLKGLFRTFALLVLLAATSGQTAPLPAKRATSPSGDFVVYSSSAQLRSEILRRTEVVEALYRKRLGEDSGQPVPVIVQEQFAKPRPRGNPLIQTQLYEGDGGALKVQTDIYDATAMRGLAFEAEIFRALCLKTAYRTKPPRAGKSFSLPPQWIIEGMTEELRVRREGAPDGVYATLLRSERPPKIEDFLKARPELMEATSLAIYRTQALSLLHALDQLPEASRGFRSLLESIDNGDQGAKPILAAFPALKNVPNLGKVWTLSIARGSTSRREQLLTLAETERLLSAVLDVSAQPPSSQPGAQPVRGPAALPLLAKSKGGPFLMRQKAAELLNLETRCHPLLRPIVQEYRRIAALLANKPGKNVNKSLEENGKIRALLLKRNNQVSDYLNWFEATKLDTPSDAFINISPPPAAPPRNDPITRYLDTVETRGW